MNLFIRRFNRTLGDGDSSNSFYKYGILLLDYYHYYYLQLLGQPSVSRKYQRKDPTKKLMNSFAAEKQSTQ